MDTTGDIRMSDLMSPATQTEGINPTSKDWHLQMKALNQQTKQLEGMSSHVVKSCVEHADTEAGQINMMDSMMGKGVHQMMGSGWKGDQEGHQDIYDAEIGGCKSPLRDARPFWLQRAPAVFLALTRVIGVAQGWTKRPRRTRCGTRSWTSSGMPRARTLRGATT